MPVALPFVSDPPIYRVGTTLDGAVYQFDVRWNARDESWYFDLLTEDGTIIRAGIKVVLGIPLGLRNVNPLFPNGMLVATDMSGAGEEAGLYDFGERVLVHFYSQDELDAL